MNAVTAVPPKPTPPQSKMRLDAVSKGRQKKPIRALLYGQEGVGKSTFGATAPKPIFLGAEDGTSHLDVSRFPVPTNWRDVLDAVRTLIDDKHDYQTLVIDSVDWIEPLLWQHMIRRDNTADRPLSTIEDYGYSKGYNIALDDWRILLASLERLEKAKGMNIILLGHSQTKTWKNPEGEDFDRYELSVNAKAGGVLKQWCDFVLFARFETFAKKDPRTKRVRGVATGARIINTVRDAAFDAKHRGELPDQLPLGWTDFVTAVEAGQSATPATLKAEIQRKAREIGGDIEKAILETLTKAGDDVRSLAVINNRVNARLNELPAGKEQ